MSSPEQSPQSNGTGRSPKPFRAHLAAVGALVVSAGFLVVVVFLVADDPAGLVLAFVWVFAFAFCGWFLSTSATSAPASVRVTALAPSSYASQR